MIWSDGKPVLFPFPGMKMTWLPSLKIQDRLDDKDRGDPGFWQWSWRWEQDLLQNIFYTVIA